MIIAVDYDGTLQDGSSINYPLIARLINEQRQGNTVILWTCRSGQRLMDAVNTLRANGLMPNYINDNAPEVIARLKNNPRKIYADVYIDDKSVKP